MQFLRQQIPPQILDRGLTLGTDEFNSVQWIIDVDCMKAETSHYDADKKGISFKNRNDQKSMRCTPNSLNCEIHSCYHLLNDASLYKRSAASDALDGSMLYL